MKAFFLSFALLLGLAAQASFQPWIIGGSEVPAGSPIAQSTVLIIGKILKASFTCTGVVYSKQLILTAGHCLGAPGWAELTVHFKLNKNSPGPAIKVIEQLRIASIPTDGKEFDWQDLALLKLASPIPANYLPAALLNENDKLQAGDDVIMAGYGRTVAQPNYSGDGGIGVLRSVQQKILQANYGQTEILASIKDRGACGGDSGGPLFIERNGKLFVAGIASRLTARDAVTGPNNQTEYHCTVDLVYTKPSAHQKWLDETASEMMK